MNSADPAPASDVAEVARTAEDFVRTHLSKALGGRRGMIEAGVPTAAFTAVFLIAHSLTAAIMGGAALTVIALVVRLFERTTVQHVLNAAIGIGIGSYFVYRSAKHGGSVDDQALAYFLPGVLFNAAYTVGMVVTVAIGWPLVGFLIGGVLGDPIGWRRSRGLVVVCNRLTLCLAVPCLLRAAVQGPLYLAGTQHWISVDVAVSALGVAKLVMGWPLSIAGFALMALLLGRSSTPLETPEPPESGDAGGSVPISVV